MPHQNEPHNYTRRGASSRSYYSSPRVSVPSARDELERERELYSAHDPRQSAIPPAQRYAQAQQEARQASRIQPGGAANTSNVDRRRYWSQHPEDAGRSTSVPNSPNSHTGSFASSSTSSRIPRYSASNSSRMPRVVGPSTGSNPSSSSQIPVVNRPSRTGRTPRVGEATLSGRISRYEASYDASVSGVFPQASNKPRAGHQNDAADQQPNTQNDNATNQQTANQPTQRSRTPHAYGSPSRNGRSGATPTRRKASQRSGAGTLTENNESTNAGSTNNGKFGGGSGRNGGGAGSFGAERYLSAKRPSSGSLRTKIIAAVAVVTVIAIGVFAFTTWDATKPVNVTINGEQKTIEGNQRSLEGLLDTNTVSVTPGNYVAVDGSVMREGEGTRATASINGENKDDLSARLNEGDDISLTNGTDITEEYTESEPQSVAPPMEMKGTGAVHLYTQAGEPGEKITRTGNESGKTADITTKEPVDGVVQCYNVNTNGEKVIALTFDDGPWDSSTEAILDTLKEYDAKATFFTVGQKIPGHEDLLKRAAEEGHELSTHTYDHAEGSGQGVSLILMSSDERKQEVEKGLQAIKDATGSDASLMFRAPGGNFDASVAADLSGIVTADIGWNIDTGDWKKPGADAIAQRIESADPGEIILMHDGGGDRSQTVEALKQALPVLKDEGYTFVTVEELINKYPCQESNAS